MKKYLLSIVFVLVLFVPFVRVSATTSSNTNAFTTPVAFGDSGANVLKIQQFLHDNGFLAGSFGGYYGQVTAKAIERFQKQAGISPTNAKRVGPKTLAALNTYGGTASIPVTKTLPATNISQTTATLNALLTAQTTAPVFLYGTTTAYGSTIKGVTSELSVSATLTQLICNTTYHYTISATNTAGTSSGGDATFTTSACVRT